jgi:hypothetical protein
MSFVAAIIQRFRAWSQKPMNGDLVLVCQLRASALRLALPPGHVRALLPAIDMRLSILHRLQKLTV